MLLKPLRLYPTAGATPVLLNSEALSESWCYTRFVKTSEASSESWCNTRFVKTSDALFESWCNTRFVKL